MPQFFTSKVGIRILLHGIALRNVSDKAGKVVLLRISMVMDHFWKDCFP